MDGVAVNEDPVVGGLCIIQAKRYSKIVGLEAVHALAGVMDDKHAAKGVLVTTSWVGKASRDFAARNGRIEIIEGHQIKSMLLEHLSPPRPHEPAHPATQLAQRRNLLTGRHRRRPSRKLAADPLSPGQ